MPNAKCPMCGGTGGCGAHTCEGCGGRGRGLSDYERGYIDGLNAYAWWKGRHQHVGTCGNTLKDAIAEFLRSRAE